jgi:hypothetical protein
VSTPHTHHRPAAPSRAERARRARRRLLTSVAATATVATVLAVVIVIGTAGTTDERRATETAPLAATGEVNAMGMPVVVTPGSASGSAAAGGVSVHGATWSMGTVPLDVAVRPTWTLRNTGDETVTLGEPRPEVRAGCCPGPATLGSHTLAPGASTTLTFELGMHAGMDGPHDLAVHVPVTGADGGTTHLEVDVNGDFRS